MASAEHVLELTELCGDARELAEGGRSYIYLPRLRLPTGCAPAEVEALLCIQEHSGYPTRLFLSQQIAGRGANWSVHRIADRTWYTWSWNNVSPQMRPSAILAEHLRAFR